MGIRPGLSLVCGINNLRVRQGKIVDSRFSPKFPKPDRWAGEFPPLPGAATGGLADEFTTAMFESIFLKPDGRKLTGEELVFWNPEFAPRLIGYTVDEDEYGRDLLYGLAACFPRFKNGFVMPVPSLPLAQARNSEAHKIRRLMYRHAPRLALCDWEGEKYPRMVWPEIEPGYYLNLKEADSHERDRIRRLATAWKMMKNGQNPDLFGLIAMESMVEAADYILKWIGLDVPKSELKLYLVLSWS